MLFDGKGEVSRTLVGDEAAFDSGDYVRGLARELGCRDGNEVWDQLFETRIAEHDWRAFFADVGQYCACIRAATAARVMEADGTLEREAQMRALVAQARAEVEGPIVAIVGGFHAGALFAESAEQAGGGIGEGGLGLSGALRQPPIRCAGGLFGGAAAAGVLPALVGLACRSRPGRPAPKNGLPP